MNIIFIIVFSFIVGAECERRWGLWTLFIEKMKDLARLIWQASVSAWWRLVTIWHKLRQVAQRALEQFVDLLVRLLYPLHQALAWVWKHIRRLVLLVGLLAAIMSAMLMMLATASQLRVSSADIWTAIFVILTLALLLVLAKEFGKQTKYVLLGIMLLFLTLTVIALNGIVTLITGLALIVLTLAVSILLADGLGKITYLLTAIGAFLVFSLKECSSEPAAPQAPEVVVPKTPASAPAEQADHPHDDWEVVAVVHARPGDGCIRITKRGGRPLSLAKCIALSKGHGRPTLWADGLIIAPTVGMREAWTLLRHRKSGELLWIIPRETIN